MDVKYLVVHCSDTPNGRSFTAEDIHKWHTDPPRRWSGIGYHAVILLDGTIQAGRPYYWKGAHVKGHNHESLGVCLIGRDEFTDEQFENLLGLLLAWKMDYPDAEVLGHRDFEGVKKECPGFDVQEWWSTV